MKTKNVLPIHLLLYYHIMASNLAACKIQKGMDKYVCYLFINIKIIIYFPTCLQYCSRFEEKLDVKNLSPSRTISVSNIKPFDVP